MAELTANRAFRQASFKGLRDEAKSDEHEPGSGR
jgi:hypothetical protein